jgi:argininosuccinate lyase
MAKLWQKDYTFDSMVEEFTVGLDYELDRDLVVADCLASVAHATMLEKIGILSTEETHSLVSELRAIAAEGTTFPISREDEDCHTAIENRLTAVLGEPGKKIHTGRSRNDQVLAALRLYERSFLLRLAAEGAETVLSLSAFAERNSSVPMPGRTHMQIAMPSSVGLWAGAFAEEILGHLSLLPGIYDLADQCPLGSAAGYGVPLPLDREHTAELLGFGRVQNNVLYASNSRSGTEGWILTLAEQIGLTLGRFAQDLILFSMPEFGYFGLPPELCSGSSIMPQKKNPDALELIRGKSNTLIHYAGAVRENIRSLPSGYNRDVQETKEPFARAAKLILQCLGVARLTVGELIVHEEKLAQGFIPEIYATDAAIELVQSGMSFRDAYREVGAGVEALARRRPVDSIANRTASGTAGNLKLELVTGGAGALKAQFLDKQRQLDAKFEELLGFVPSVFR